MGTLILLAALTVAVAVGLAILFNKLVVKDFPESDRKAGSIKTFFVFIILFVVIFAVLYGKVIADASVKSFSAQIEQDIKKNYSNLDIVKNGIDVAAASKDINKLNNTVNDITRIIKPGELGVPKFVWNIALGYIRKELQKIFTGFNAVKNAASPFLDERNYLTVSSLFNGLQVTILKIIKITVIVLVSVCVILLGIYVLASLSKTSKEKKRLEGK
jgi:ABC-type multidrug transport system fused ATPase/permease subunit